MTDLFSANIFKEAWEVGGGIHSLIFSRFKSVQKDSLQFSLLILRELKRINSLLLPLKLSKNHRFSDKFRRE